MTEGRRKRGDGRPLALVTGASGGIGEAFARRLARDGYDLVLVARREDRLEAVADELQKDFGVRVEVIRADLTDEEELAAVEERVKGVSRLDCLVNNAGFMMPKLFAEAETDVWDAMVRLHALATVRLTHAALGGMIARRSGSIINVSSVAAFLPLPWNVVYSATKILLVTFTEGLRQELHGTGIRLQVLCPGWTRTGLVADEAVDTSAIGRHGWMEADDVVDYSLRCLERGKLVCIPGWRNRWTMRVCRMTWRPLLRWIIRKTRTNQVKMKEGRDVTGRPEAP